MAGYTIAIQQDSPIYKLYRKLKDDGVKDDDLDTGYPQTDYVNKTRRIVHQDDHQIEAREVLNFALEHYERYQLAIRETTGYDVPWSLDDLNPATDFDAKIRDKVDRAITAFKQSLSAKGLKEGTGRYNELLALALYAFTLTCQPINVGGRQAVEIPIVLSQELSKEKLIGVIDYLVENGGLLSTPNQEDCKLEANVLEALAKGCGWCTEHSTILYTLMKRAGLNAKMLFVIPSARSNRKADLAATTYHMSVSVQLDKKMRIFDPSMKRSNAAPFYEKSKFVWWFEQDSVERLSRYFSDLGADLDDAGRLEASIEQYKSALAINYDNEAAHYNMGLAFEHKSEPDRATKEYQTAVEINPNYAAAHFRLGNIYDEQNNLDRALEEFKTAVRLDPEDAAAHNCLGIVYAKMGEMEQAIASFKLAAKIEPKLPQSYENLTRILTLKGIALEEAGESSGARDAYRQAGAMLKKTRQRHGHVTQDVIDLIEYKLGTPARRSQR